MAALLAGQDVPPPALPDIPGRTHTCADKPLSDAELAQITDPRELALCVGIDLTEARRRLRATKGTKP